MDTISLARGEKEKKKRKTDKAREKTAATPGLGDSRCR